MKNKTICKQLVRRVVLFYVFLISVGLVSTAFSLFQYVVLIEVNEENK